MLENRSHHPQPLPTSAKLNQGAVSVQRLNHINLIFPIDQETVLCRLAKKQIILESSELPKTLSTLLVNLLYHAVIFFFLAWEQTYNWEDFIYLFLILGYGMETDGHFHLPVLLYISRVFLGSFTRNYRFLFIYLYPLGITI